MWAKPASSLQGLGLKGPLELFLASLETLIAWRTLPGRDTRWACTCRRGPGSWRGGGWRAGQGGQSTVQISGWIQAEVRATTARHRNRTFMVLMIDMCCFFLQVANANVLVLKPCGSFYILLSIIHINTLQIMTLN